MTDYTPYQRKIIKRYYDNQDELMVQRLSEIVSELYLADTPKKLEQLWRRAETALDKSSASKSQVRRVLEKRDPALLARLVEDVF